MGFFEEPDLESLGLSPAGFPVHPIFQHTNIFSANSGNLIWLDYPTIADYEGLVQQIGQVLRLASNMLRSPGSLDTLYQILWAPRKEVQGFSFHGQPVSELKPRVQPGLDEHVQVRQALNRLAASLSFRIVDNIGSHGVTEPSLAFYPRGINILGQDTPKGIASITCIDGRFLAQLTALKARPGDNTSQILVLQTKMAITFCHEVVHALNHAKDHPLLIGAQLEKQARDDAKERGQQRANQRVVSNEPFGENDSMAELGYYWENAVFGGQVEIDHNNQDYPLFVSRWPSHLKEGDYPKRRENEDSAIHFIVPMHYLWNINSQHFWKEMVEGDRSALYIHGMVGIRRFKEPSSEQGHIRTNNGQGVEQDVRVSRYSEEDGFGSDPSASHANEKAANRAQRRNRRLDDEYLAMAARQRHR